MGAIRLSGVYRSDDFETDGSLRDVCILGVDIREWEHLLLGVRASTWEHKLELDDTSRSLEEFSVAEFFSDRGADVDASARLAIRVGQMWFDCFFFDRYEIEFSFDPAEIREGEEFDSLREFMIWLAGVCGRRVILTMETTHHDDMPALLETVAD